MKQTGTLVNINSMVNDVVDQFVDDNNLFALFDTPANVLFADNFINNIKKYKDVFAQFNMGENIFFSCKANKAFSFLKLASNESCGIEVSSVYELKDAKKFTNKIIASGPAKSEFYIKEAIACDSIISVDDIEELKLIVKQNKSAKIFLRLSDINETISRFGINKGDVNKCLDIIKYSKINLIGLAFHINNYNLEDRINAINQCLLINKKYNLNIKYIDIGGGIPISYCSKSQWNNFKQNMDKVEYFNNKKFTNFYPYYSNLTSEKFLKQILRGVKSNLKDIQIIIEPGRSLLNNCGISIYEVMYTKHLNNGDNIIVTNGNINDLSEQWFNTDYLIEPKLIVKDKNKKPIIASVAGNLCLEQDIITWRKIKFDFLPQRGDLLVYYNTAGYQMDSNESNFHKIPLVEKFVVKKTNEKYVIKKDKSYDSR